jgi:putative ubiquitin-RnfH superfamily antitoxin RatB of RatAB toxin-antitoxin module
MKLTHLGLPPSSIPLGIQAEENLFRKILQDLEKQARIEGGIQRRNCWKSHMLKNQKKVEINPPALLDAKKLRR